MEDRDLIAAMGSMTILDRFACCFEAEVRVFGLAFLCLSAAPVPDEVGRLLDPLLLLERDYYYRAKGQPMRQMTFTFEEFRTWVEGGS
jgi:hypothetical protein